MSKTPNTQQAATDAAVANAAVERLLKIGAEVVARKRATGADVVRVAEWGINGPTRLTLRCPGRNGVACGTEHDRAVQDAHQAHLCPACRRAEDKARKNRKRAAKAGALKKTVADLNAKLLELEAQLAAKQG